VKLSSQEEYGLRCALNLAKGSDSAARTIAQISAAEGLSTEYAGKLLGILGKSGLVESVRGRHGGYRLTRSAAEISVAAVLAALGSAFYRGETCERFAGEQELCVHTNACSIRSLWSGLQMLMDHLLTRTTLQDLVMLEERNVTAWIGRHLDVLRELEPLHSFGPIEADARPDATRPSDTRQNVVVRGIKH
jgi:Rrf2 family protein